MEIHPPSYVYRCVPPVLGNDVAEQPFVIRLRGISRPEFKNQIALQQGLDATALIKSDNEFVVKHIDGIECPVIDGKEIKTWSDVCEYLPIEFASWIEKAIYSTYMLSTAERKNS
jgi:hypothetical protein